MIGPVDEKEHEACKHEHRHPFFSPDVEMCPRALMKNLEHMKGFTPPDPPEGTFSKEQRDRINRDAIERAEANYQVSNEIAAIRMMRIMGVNDKVFGDGPLMLCQWLFDLAAAGKVDKELAHMMIMSYITAVHAKNAMAAAMLIHNAEAARPKEGLKVALKVLERTAPRVIAALGEKTPSFDEFAEHAVDIMNYAARSETGEVTDVVNKMMGSNGPKTLQ